MGDAGAPDPRRRARRRALLVAAVLLVLFAANGVWIARSLRGLGGGAARVGQPAPTFSGATLAGPPLALTDLRGKVVMLDFWATWCAPCLAEMPALRRLQESRGPRGLAVVGINIEGQGARRAVADVVQDAGLTFPTVMDEGEIQRRYRVEGVPFVVVIDRVGIVRRIFPGATTAAELERAVDQALAGTAAN
jgi:thiol-disulfide isomerase/thioredoxin